MSLTIKQTFVNKIDIFREYSTFLNFIDNFESLSFFDKLKPEQAHIFDLMACIERGDIIRLVTNVLSSQQVAEWNVMANTHPVNSSTNPIESEKFVENMDQYMDTWTSYNFIENFYKLSFYPVIELEQEKIFTRMIEEEKIQLIRVINELSDEEVSEWYDRAMISVLDAQIDH